MPNDSHILELLLGRILIPDHETEVDFLICEATSKRLSILKDKRGRALTAIGEPGGEADAAVEGIFQLLFQGATRHPTDRRQRFPCCLT